MKRHREELIDIRRYRDQMFDLDILGIKRKLPLCQMEDEMWIVVNDSLCFGCDVGNMYVKNDISYYPYIIIVIYNIIIIYNITTCRKK